MQPSRKCDDATLLTGEVESKSVEIIKKSSLFDVLSSRARNASRCSRARAIFNGCGCR